MLFRSGRLAFVTLTYAPIALPDGVSGCAADLTNFFKRLRITLKRRFGISGLRYVAVLERGGTGTKRFHWHVIFFGVSALYLRDVVADCWKNGFVDVRRFGEAHIRYLAKYISKGGACDVKKSQGLGYKTIVGLVDKAVGRVSGSASFDEKEPVEVPWSYRSDGRNFGMTPYLHSKLVDAVESRGFSVIRSTRKKFLEYSRNVLEREVRLKFFGVPTSRNDCLDIAYELLRPV